MGEFCTDLFFTVDGLLPTELTGPEPGLPVTFGGTEAPPTAEPPAGIIPCPPPTIADSPDSELEVARLGMFSFDARSIAELRRIMMVLVWGSMSCSMLLLLLLPPVAGLLHCWWWLC